MDQITCRFCDTPLRQVMAELGMSPLCNKMVSPDSASAGEVYYPLRTYVCESCLLCQLGEFATPDEIFGDGEYTYFSSFSTSWLAHAKRYVDAICQRLGLSDQSFVVEIASNDGYLLQNFVKRGIPCLGIEPASNCAEAAKDKGVESLVEFFGTTCAERVASTRGQADLVLGNNVLAHTPALGDFVAGIARLLKPTGVVTMEFPHLLRLMQDNQFDTIYHEHFSYFSWLAVERIFAHHGLTLFDVEQLDTHGGSLRIYGRSTAQFGSEVLPAVEALRAEEREAGLHLMDTYDRFDEQVRETKRKLLSFLIEQKRAGKRIAGYGAPGKGNTLLNYCGIGTDFIDFTVDRSPHKQGKLLPGSRIPVLAPEAITARKPDFVLILPWNLTAEITEQMSVIREWGGQFVVPIPEVKIV